MELKELLKQYFKDSVDRCLDPESVVDQLSSDQLAQFNQLLDIGVDTLVQTNANLEQVSEAAKILDQKFIAKLTENNLADFKSPLDVLHSDDSIPEGAVSIIDMDLQRPKRCYFWPFCLP